MVITPIMQGLKDIFVRMRNNTIPQISGYYDTIVKRGNDVDVYTNKAAIEILSKQDKQALDNIQQYINGLSDADLITYISQYLSKEAVDEYTKYLSNPDIKGAIARSILEATLPDKRKAGIKVGTSSKGGDMSIKLPANTTKLILYAAAWKGVTGLSLNISGATANPTSIALTADDGISNSTPFTLSGNEDNFKFEIALSDIIMNE